MHHELFYQDRCRRRLPLSTTKTIETEVDYTSKVVEIQAIEVNFERFFGDHSVILYRMFITSGVWYVIHCRASL